MDPDPFQDRGCGVCPFCVPGCHPDLQTIAVFRMVNRAFSPGFHLCLLGPGLLARDGDRGDGNLAVLGILPAMKGLCRPRWSVEGTM